MTRFLTPDDPQDRQNWHVFDAGRLAGGLVTIAHARRVVNISPPMRHLDLTFRPDGSTIAQTGEVEVARISYSGPPCPDVVCVRAKREGMLIGYRVVTTEGKLLASWRNPSALPLTLGQLIKLIHRAKGAGSHQHYVRHLDRVPGSKLPMYKVASDHYPDLAAYQSAKHRAHGNPGRPPSGDGPMTLARVETIRRGLLTKLRWEERAKGFRRTKPQRVAAAERFMSLRFV